MKKEILNVYKKIQEIKDIRDIEKILDNFDDAFLREFGNEGFQTLSIFFNKIRPSFFYTKNNKEKLEGLFIPWKSIAGSCILENKIKITTSADPLHYDKPSKETNVKINYISAYPLKYKENAFGCIEFLTYKHPKNLTEEFEEFSIVITPFLYDCYRLSIEPKFWHDIKNKLMGISEVLRYSKCEIGQEAIDMASESVRDIYNIVNDKIRNLTVAYNLEKFNMNDLVEQSIEKAKMLSLLNSKNIDIEREIKEEQIVVYGDKKAIADEIFLNLLKNSWEAWDEKNIENRKIVFRTYKENENCVVVYEDNAGGIPEKIRNKIFRSYITTKEEGSGIGLGSAYDVAKFHNGNIEYKPLKDGSAFYLTLPLCY
jgi:two-component sensor histidine kinase